MQVLHVSYLVSIPIDKINQFISYIFEYIIAKALINKNRLLVGPTFRVVVLEVVGVVVLVVDPTFKALLVVSEVVFVAAWVFDGTVVVVGFFAFSSTPSYLLDRYFSNSDPSVSKAGVITTLYSS